jgi:hypothetical protein
MIRVLWIAAALVLTGPALAQVDSPGDQITTIQPH